MLVKTSIALAILVALASNSSAGQKQDFGAANDPAGEVLINRCMPGNEPNWNPACYRKGWFSD
jgi:hypothetical protein